MIKNIQIKAMDKVEYLVRQSEGHVVYYFLIGMTVLIFESEFSIPALQTHQTTTTAYRIHLPRQGPMVAQRF